MSDFPAALKSSKVHSRKAITDTMATKTASAGFIVRAFLSLLLKVDFIEISQMSVFVSECSMLMLAFSGFGSISSYLALQLSVKL